MTRNTSRLSVQNVEILNATAGGARSFHWAPRITSVHFKNDKRKLRNKFSARDTRHLLPDV
jgi:hypothetical protein